MSNFLIRNKVIIIIITGGVLYHMCKFIRNTFFEYFSVDNSLFFIYSYPFGYWGEYVRALRDEGAVVDVVVDPSAIRQRRLARRTAVKWIDLM